MILTYKFRIKDATAGKRLARHAIACNQVWNFCVATQREAERRHKGGMNVRAALSAPSTDGAINAG